MCITFSQAEKKLTVRIPVIKEVKSVEPVTYLDVDKDGAIVCRIVV